MTEEQKASYINAMVVCATAEIAGMQAANHSAAMAGGVPVYDAAAFEAIPNKYGIHHNAVVGFFRD